MLDFEEHPEVVKNRVKGGDADQYQSVNEAVSSKNDRIDLADRPCLRGLHLTTEALLINMTPFFRIRVSPSQ